MLVINEIAIQIIHQILYLSDFKGLDFRQNKIHKVYAERQSECFGWTVASFLNVNPLYKRIFI